MLRSNSSKQRVYFTSGDALFEKKQAIEQLIAHFDEIIAIEKFSPSNNDEWQHFFYAASSLSLFYSKKIFIITLQGLNLSKSVIEKLNHLINNPDPYYFIFSLPKLPKKIPQWLEPLLHHAEDIRITPFSNQENQKFFQNLCQKKNLSLTKNALHEVFILTEGDLFAREQAIDLLTLTYAPMQAEEKHLKNIDAAAVRACITDHAQFSPFDLMPTIHQGQLTEINRLLNFYQKNQTPLASLLGLMVKDLRLLIQLAFYQQQNISLIQLFKQYAIWPKLQPLFRQSLSRHTYSFWTDALQKAAKIDHALKGVEKIPPWQAFRSLSLKMTSSEMDALPWH